jgi:oligopeptide/dipeptide ABC transporter ATP-binding protein
MSDALLEIRDLSISAQGRRNGSPIVRDVSFDVAPGEAVGIVGESGSGKTLTMLSVMGLLPSPPLRVTSGQIHFDGKELTHLGDRALRRIRGSELAMIYQDPMTSLNPVMRIGDQIAEAMTAHDVDAKEARQRTRAVLADVGIPDPDRTARAYPHEFSGGMRQRVMIATALSLSPKLLIADEPTTALDVTIQQQILALVRALQERRGMAIVWITHDLGVVARLVERLIIMYAGTIVEQGPTKRIFTAPEHPYTAGLIAALPDPADKSRAPLAQIPGSPPELTAVPRGCPFRPRCRQAVARCAEERPALTDRGGGASAACFVPPTEWKP